MYPTQTDPLQPNVVLGIAAHPDDLDFGAGGTMASYAAAGAEVHYLILTDGSKGTADPHISPADLMALRETEQRAAMAAIGGKSVEFLHYSDGELEVSQELKKAIVRVIRKLKPDVVITFDPTVVYAPERGFINHPDHRAAGQAALDAVFPLARDHLSFPDLYDAGFLPHKTPHVLLVRFGQPGTNFTVDITGSFEAKVAALRAHASQMGDIEVTSNWVRELAETAGKTANCELAESFVRIDTQP